MLQRCCFLLQHTDCIDLYHPISDIEQEWLWLLPQLDNSEVRAKMDGLSLTLQGRRWRVAAKEELEGKRDTTHVL